MKMVQIPASVAMLAGDNMHGEKNLDWLIVNMRKSANILQFMHDFAYEIYDLVGADFMEFRDVKDPVAHAGNIRIASNEKDYGNETVSLLAKKYKLRFKEDANVGRGVSATKKIPTGEKIKIAISYGEIQIYSDENKW